MNKLQMNYKGKYENIIFKYFTLFSPLLFCQQACLLEWQEEMSPIMTEFQ